MHCIAKEKSWSGERRAAKEDDPLVCLFITHLTSTWLHSPKNPSNLPFSPHQEHKADPAPAADYPT